MRVRDAVQDDAAALAALADLPVSAATHLIVDRTVRVAERDGAGAPDETPAVSTASGESQASAADPEPGTSEDAPDETAVRGFVAFDARPSVVHVTQLLGDDGAVERLLDEPVRFAEREGMAVEVVVLKADGAVCNAVEAFGFAPAGPGPRFDGQPTCRYRLETDEPDD